MVKVIGLDHIVLNCADVDRSLAWYCGTLGLDGVRVEDWREGKAPFPSVRVNAHTIIDLAVGERTGVNVDHVGLATSLYVRDPDGNTVELRSYS